MIGHTSEPAALLYDVSRLIRRRFGEQIADLGMTEPQWRVLGFLHRSEGLSQTELAELLGIRKAPLGEQIDRLEVAGVVERRPDPGDRRVRRLYLTARGRRTAVQITRRFDDLRQTLTQAVGIDAWEQLERALQALAEGLLTGPVRAALQRIRVDGATHLIGITARQLRRRFDHALKELGFTRTEWLVMVTVLAHSGVTQSELAVLIDIGKTPVAQLVDRLQHHGWIERRTNPDDRRVNHLSLATGAEARMQNVLERYRVLHRGLLQPLDESCRAALIVGLEKCRSALIGLAQTSTDATSVAADQE